MKQKIIALLVAAGAFAASAETTCITDVMLVGGQYAFEGFTAKAGTYLVTVKATLNGKSVTQRLLLEVDGLPAWAKGTYNGYVAGAHGATNGLATVTVSSVGKISGKFYEGGTNWTLSAASYTGYDPDASNCTATVTATYTYKVKSGKKTLTKSVTRTFAFTVAPVPIVPNVPDVPIRGVAAMVEAGGSQLVATEITAYQNLWGSTYKAVGQQLFYTSKKKPYRTFSQTVEVDGKECALSLNVTPKGAVTATLTYDTGKTTKDPKTKKQVKVIYKPTCSTVVIPTSAADADPFTGEAFLFFAPSAGNNFPGFAAVAPF